jgi:hypothetical protein
MQLLHEAAAGATHMQDIKTYDTECLLKTSRHMKLEALSIEHIKTCDTRAHSSHQITFLDWISRI